MAGGLNLYGYANSDPVNFRDQSGLSPDPDGWCPRRQLGGIHTCDPIIVNGNPDGMLNRHRLDGATRFCGNGFISFLLECVPLSAQYRRLAPDSRVGGGRRGAGIATAIVSSPIVRCAASSLNLSGRLVLDVGGIGTAARLTRAGYYTAKWTLRSFVATTAGLKSADLTSRAAIGMSHGLVNKAVPDFAAAKAKGSLLGFGFTALGGAAGEFLDFDGTLERVNAVAANC